MRSLSCLKCKFSSFLGPENFATRLADFIKTSKEVFAQPIRTSIPNCVLPQGQEARTPTSQSPFKFEALNFLTP